MSDVTLPEVFAPMNEVSAIIVTVRNGKAPRQNIRTETGRVISHAALLEAVAKRAAVEIVVQEGERPEFVACGDCGVPVKVSDVARGNLPKRCKECKKIAKKKWASLNPSKRNPENIRKNSKEYRKRNPSKASAANETWKKNNPDKSRDIRRKSSAKYYEQNR